VSETLAASTVDKVVNDYLAAWNERDATARRALLERVWYAEGSYVDPQAAATNRNELEKMIAGFQASNPEAHFILRGGVDQHHGHVRFYWTLRLGPGREMAGMDYGEVDGAGRLTKIVGFF
jgi:hypothetical protein